MKWALVLVLAASLMIGACNGMTHTQQRAIGGTAICAGSGALIGWAAGNPAAGAAIGAGAGLLGGLIYDQYEKSRGRP